jgi:hypothetical protein
MANTRAWKNAVTKYGISFGSIDLNTIDTYSLIREMGLPTVLWEKHTVENKRSLEKMLASANNFILKNNPCLFIWDPITADLDKGYFVNVNDSKIIFDWVNKNKNKVENYNYLLTTQIINPGDGFVGNAISDGKGKMFVETLHTPGICNHRDLTQPQKKDEAYLDSFSVDDFSLGALKGNFLLPLQVQEIIENYVSKDGFFEFNYGEHLGNRGVYTVGFQRNGIFSLPLDLHNWTMRNCSYRCYAARSKQLR